MKRAAAVFTTLVLVFLCTGALGEALGAFTLNWTYEPVKYENFTDLGNFLLLQNDMDYSECGAVLANAQWFTDPFAGACTAAAKRNGEGEVIIGRNMDFEISEYPAIVTRLAGGRYNTMTISYGGVSCGYTYSQLSEIDEDPAYLKESALFASDAFNEAGLYVEINMRECDYELDFSCSGTNPGRERVCMLAAPALITANCATLPEALEYLNNSFDWYTLGYIDYTMDEAEMWNLAMIIGDAEGNYGLVEFANNKIYFTPYANGQANYYIHPDLAEYADCGSGYGRLSAALEGLMDCETEWDMLYNMQACSWSREVLDPGRLGYSDIEVSLKARREATPEELQLMLEEFCAPLQKITREYFAGNETALRENGCVWTTSFNIGVNCAKKHLILRLWENSNVIFEYQW